MRQRISFQRGRPVCERESSPSGYGFPILKIEVWEANIDVNPTVEGLDSLLFCDKRIGRHHPMPSAISRMRVSEKRGLNVRLILVHLPPNGSCRKEFPFSLRRFGSMFLYGLCPAQKMRYDGCRFSPMPRLASLVRPFAKLARQQVFKHPPLKAIDFFSSTWQLPIPRGVVVKERYRKN